MNQPKTKNKLLSFFTNGKKIIFILLSLSCLIFTIDTPLALLLGILFSFIAGNPYPKSTKKITRYLLQLSIIGLGFGMDLVTAIKVGKEGLIFTIASICITLLIGITVGRLLHINKKIAFLIASGTAICGGSAIAAISPLIHADEEETTLSMATIFILNSIALFVFPVLGHIFHLTQEQFGYWSALAIHDTSSVVGAAQHYGAKALEIATMVKLERALWIIPLSFVTLIAFKEGKEDKGKKIKIPYFIFLFLLAIIANTYIPKYFPIFFQINHWLVGAAKKGLTLTLFFIGANLNLKSIKKVGIEPFLLGGILWIIISIVSLIVLQFFF